MSTIHEPDAAEDRLHEPARIAAILRTFYLAPLSASSLQPVLELAVELNPDLAGTLAYAISVTPR